MKYLKHLEFILTTALLIIIITLLITYTFSAIFIHTGLSFITVFLTYFFQTIILIISTSFLLSKFKKEYFDKLNELKVGPLKKVVFAVIFSIMLMVLLFFFDYLFSWIIDYGLSNKYGHYLDELVMPEDGSIMPENDSFKLMPITLQNIIFNILAFVIILFISKAKYKTNE